MFRKPREIERIAHYFFASELAGDEEDRREGGSEQLFQGVARQLSEAGIDYYSPYRIGVPPPKFGLSDREMLKRAEMLEWTLPAAQKALARGNISSIQWEVDELLKAFRINLGRDPIYRASISAPGPISAISAINFLMSKSPKELKSFATKTKAPGPPITLSR